MKITYIPAAARVKFKPEFKTISSPDVTRSYSYEFHAWCQQEYATSLLVGQCSVRKFRRLLKQWSIYLPPGTEFVLMPAIKRNRRWYYVQGKTT